MEYETTHPWLTFDAGTLVPRGSAQQAFFFTLGEISSKVTHLQDSALLPETANELDQEYLAKGIAATTAIEGNTLGEDTVGKLVKSEPVNIMPSLKYQEQEVLNILGVCNEFRTAVSENPASLPPVSVELIHSFNAKIRANLPYDENEGGTPGRIRHHSVIVGRYRGAPPQDCEHLMRRLVEWLNSDTFNAPATPWPVGTVLLQAIAAHIYLVWIHPYGDGNGRTARLLEHYLLMRAGLPAPACHLLSDHYNRTRDQYYHLLEKSSMIQPYDLTEFIAYALRGFRDGLREQIERIQEQQASILWKHLIHDQFSHRTSAVDIRRRQLALYISDTDRPVRLRTLENLPPAAYNEYKGLTTRALKRDLNTLEKMGLIRDTDRGYEACKERVKAMKPARAAATGAG